MFFINYKDKRPIYEQLIDSIKQSIIAGILVEDQQLPSVRQLAIDMAINPNTIQKAYRELEQQQIIYSVKGKGSFVGKSQHSLVSDAKDKFFKDMAVFLNQSMELGINLEEIQVFINSHFLQGGQDD